ncbi:MAG: saccharopine dehydrogenase NADP-binding domain-containing protein, partial [Gaiellaceae bacterium]
MRVLVVGAGGVGAAVAAVAQRRDFFERIVLADVDASRAQTAVDRTGDPRFAAAAVDASDPAAIAELARTERADAILNAVDPRFNPAIFQAAFDAGCTYLDMAMTLSEPHPERPHEEPGVKLGDAQFAEASRWEEAGQLALVGIGVE